MRNAVRAGLRASTFAVLGIAACQSPPTEPEVIPKDELASAPEPQPAHRIAFAGDAGAGWQVYTIRDDGTGLSQLTTLPGNLLAGSTTWSPAGPSRIAFQVWDELAGIQGTSRVAVIQPNGTGFQYLTPDEDVLVWDLRWSPDGDRLAYVITDTFGDSLRLLVVNADGSGPDTVARHVGTGSVTWSPDGQRIAYFRNEDNPRTVPDERGIWTVKPDGTEPTRVRAVPESSGSYRFLRFSPDGQKLAGCHMDADWETYTLQVMDAAGDGLVNLPLGCFWKGYGSSLAWSPSGIRILAQPDNNLHTIAPDGSDALQLTTSLLSPNVAGSWSRQSTRIAYVHKVGLRDGSEDYALFTMSANGNAKKRLTPVGMDVGDPSWGP